MRLIPFKSATDHSMILLYCLRKSTNWFSWFELKLVAMMIGRVLLGPRYAYFSVFENGFSSSYDGDWVDDRGCFLAKLGSGTYLIFQGGRMDDLGASSKVFTSGV